MSWRALHNPKTGETILFSKTADETGGELFEMSYTMAPHAAIADVHAHPHQEMTIEVTRGTLTCTIDGVDVQIAAGESATIPAGTYHFQRNDTEEELHAVEQYRPALQMQQFFEVLIGWASDDKTDEHGLPTLLRRAVMHRYFRDSIRSASRRLNLEAMVLAPVATLLGYRRELERYISPS